MFRNLLRTVLLVVAALLLLNKEAGAQHTLKNYRLFTKKDGLPDNYITRLLQDRNGYLWVGTSTGLSRFNGTSFYNFNSASLDFPMRTCKELLQFNDSILLVGTTSGLVVYNLQRNIFQNRKIRDSFLTEGSNHAVDYLVRLPGGRLLVSFDNYIALLDQELRTIKRKKVASHRLQRYQFRRPVFMNTDSTLLLTGPDMLILDVQTLESKPAAFQSDVLFTKGDRSISSMTITRQGTLLFSYWGQGLFHYQFPTRKMQQLFISKTEGGEYNAVADIRQDPDNTNLYWLCTGSGYKSIELPSMRQTSYSFDKKGGTKDIDYCIQSIRDKDGNTWVATAGGLIKISSNAQSFTHLDSKKFHALGKQPGSEYLAAATDLHNKLWLATYGSPIFRCTIDGDSLLKFDAANSGLRGPVHNLAVYRDTVYVASFFDGLFYYDKTSQKFRYPAFLPGPYQKQVTNNLFFDSRNRCWMSTKNELYYLDMQSRALHTVSKFTNPSGLPRAPYHFAEAGNGDMWLALGGWEGKLFKWEAHTGKISEIPLVINGRLQNKLLINQLFRDKDNNLWIGTYEFGLLLLDARTQKIKVFTEANGLKSSVVNSITRDAYEGLWVGTNYGLAYMPKGMSRFQVFTVDDGLPDNKILWLGFPQPDQPDRLLALMKDEVGWIDISRLQGSRTIPNTLIESVHADHQQLVDADPVIPYNHEQLQFQFSGVNISNGEENEYAYQLVGHHDTWIPNGKSTLVTYSGLRPGQYTFRVRSSMDGINWSEPAQYKFTIATPFWQTWWFYLLCLIIIAATVYRIYQYQLGKAIAVHKVRSSISKDLHDEVGSTLSSISLMAEMASRQTDEQVMWKKIKDSISNVQNSMSDIVWVINPKNDRLDNLQLRFAEVAAEMLEPRGIRYQLDLNAQGNRLRISMEKRRELFLIYKESLNNIVKYSGCTEVLIGLYSSGKNIRLVVQDNGRGFDPRKHFSGNGISNMKARAGILKGQLTLDSEAGTGTRIILDFPNQ